MIRIVTAGRVRRLEQDADRARCRAREVQGQADAAWGRHVREVGDLAARAEEAEIDAGILREHVFELEAALKKSEGEAETLKERADRSEAAASESGVLFSHAVEELSAAQQELLLREIEIRRLREELRGMPVEGRTLMVLLHHGEPHTIYASREDAYADTATHGVPAGTRWVPSAERTTAACTWCLETFIYHPESRGFRRVHMPARKPVGGAA